MREGADKISINSAAIMNPTLISEAADKFGSQCVVVAIDAKKRDKGSGGSIYKNGGRVDMNIEWEDKKNLVENGDLDCIWGCFSIKGRENDYKWTKPYMVSRQVVAVNKSSNIYSLSDLEGKIIAVQSTTKPEEIFLNRTDSKIPEVKEVFSLEDREQIYTYLGKGYVDAISAHETAIRQYMQDYDMDYRILDESIFVTGIGAAFAINDDRGIEEKLSEKFDEMQKDGTMEIIVSKYLSNAYKYLEVLYM